MHRSGLLLGIAALAAACATPTPTATVVPSLAPSAQAAPASGPTLVPTPTPTVRPAMTEGPVVPDESDEPAVRPLEVDWDAAPEFPSPVVVVGTTRARAVGESGCPSLIYEPADSETGPLYVEKQGACTNAVLSFAKPARSTAGSSLAFKVPEGWGMGAQVVADAEPYGPFWIIEAKRLASRPAGVTPLADVAGGGWVEIARGEGFGLDALDAPAPDAPGDYLVSVQTQVGQVAREWRTYGRTYYYWVRVR